MRKAKSCNGLLSLVLCICMVLSLAPVQVLALDACDHGDGCRTCPVQKLVDALPDEVTAESAEAVAAQLAAIDSEKASLTDEELAQVDFAKYTAAISAINDLAGQTGTQEAVAADTSDFEISDGVLIRYFGSAESVEIPDGVTEIGEMAFSGNLYITFVTIPNSVTTIGRGAFRNAKSLQTVNIPSSVTSIGDEAFYGTDIRRLHLPDSLTSIGKMAFYQSPLVTVDFYGTGNRADLVIGEQAFQGCSILSDLCLASVSHIGSYAFQGCSRLTTLEYRGTTIPTHGSQPFSGTQVSEVYVTDAYTSNSFCGIPVSVVYYTITFSAEPSRGGYAFRHSDDPGIGRVGASIYLDAISRTGYDFVGWKYEGEIVSTEQYHSFTMPAKAVTYIAVFEKNHTCDNTTYTDAGNGTHSYECSVCGINAENHSFDTSSSCTVCGAACKHESYTDGTCTACGVACGHSFDTDGLCTVCGGYEPAVLSSSVYQISNTGQLFWFAELVNEGSTRASAVLTANITIPAGMNWTPIGNASQPYYGTFNGGDHTISGLYFSDDSADYVGLFGIVESTGKIQNTGLVETSIMAKKSVGTVVGYSLGTVERCWAENITVSATANLGGVVGFNRGTVNNCWVSGDVTMRNTSNSAGGIVGYNYGSVSNCFSLARVTGTARQGALIGTINKHESLSTAGSITNCYYDSSTTAVAVANVIDGTVTDVSSKTTETFASGEVVYLLGEAWGQTIGNDNYPVLGGRKVYQVKNCKEETDYSNANEDLGHIWSNGKCTTCGAGCDHNGSTHNTVTDKGDGTHSFTCTVCGTIATEDHTGGEATCTTQAVCEVCGASYGDVDKTNHDETVTYVNGFCPHCDTYKPATLNADGYYEISNAGQLMWFAELVNAGNFTASAILTDDIDMNGLMWTPIGTETAYTGTFDGKGFAIRNLWQNSGGANGSRDGLVVTLGTGGTVTGITVDNAAIWGADLYSTNGVGVIANRNYGTISECVVKNSSVQQGAYEYLGGIAGENSGTIENCAVIGCSFTRRWGGTDSGSMGAITQTNNGTVKNCFSYGCAFNNGRADKAAIVAINNGTLENCYYYTTSTVATTYGTAKTAEQFATGEVAYLLGEAWGQTVGTEDHPILGGKKVYYGYVSCADDAVMVYSNDSDANVTKPAHAPAEDDGDCTTGILCTACGDPVVQGKTAHDFVAGLTCGNDGCKLEATVSVSSNGGQETRYATLQDAFTAVSSATAQDNTVVKLLADIDLDIYTRQITSGIFTLDLNGKTVISAATWEAITVNGTGAMLTITDSGTGGTIRNMVGIAGTAVGVLEGTLVVSGGILTGRLDGVYVYGGRAEINGGTISGGTCGVDVGEATVTITGGVINGDSTDVDIYGGTVVISGGTFPGGISISYQTTLNAILAEGAAYWQDGKQLTVADDAIEITGGDVVVKPACVHNWVAATCVAPKTCTVCGATEGEALGHSYDNDVCTVCGHIGVPVKLDSASLSFKGKIHYNIFFSLGLDETVDLSNMGLIMFDSLNSDGTMDDAIAIYSGAVEMDGKYMVATDGVHAKRMGDTIYFRVYAKLADGSYVYSKTVEYSAVTYAEHILAGDESESAKALVVAMLNYGAAAQKFFGYNTDNLVNAFLTEEQKALPEQYRDDMVNTVPVVAGEKQGSFANNKGFSKRMPAVSFEGAFEINYFFTPAYAPVDGITLYYWTEADFEANEVLTADNATGSLKLEGIGMEQYRSDIGGIAAKNLSENIYVAAVYSDGTTNWTSGVLGYSIGAYCGRLAAKGGAMADLAMATAVYGYHAKQYFG